MLRQNSAFSEDMINHGSKLLKAETANTLKYLHLSVVSEVSVRFRTGSSPCMYNGDIRLGQPSAPLFFKLSGSVHHPELPSLEQNKVLTQHRQCGCSRSLHQQRSRFWPVQNMPQRHGQSKSTRKDFKTKIVTVQQSQTAEGRQSWHGTWKQGRRHGLAHCDSGGAEGQAGKERIREHCLCSCCHRQCSAAGVGRYAPLSA